MIPLSLSLRNFLSYGENVPPLDFTQFRIACLTGDNGHGKSALLDGITYALWGEARSAHFKFRELCASADATRVNVLRCIGIPLRH